VTADGGQLASDATGASRGVRQDLLPDTMAPDATV